MAWIKRRFAKIITQVKRIWQWLCARIKEHRSVIVFILLGVSLLLFLLFYYDLFDFLETIDFTKKANGVEVSIQLVTLVMAVFGLYLLIKRTKTQDQILIETLFNNAVGYFVKDDVHIRISGVELLEGIARKHEQYCEEVYKIFINYLRYVPVMDEKGETQKPIVDMKDKIIQYVFVDENSRIKYEKFGPAILPEAKLTNANLVGANLSNAQFQRAELHNTKLQEADLSNAQLQEADLRNARLQGADLSNARLQGAELHNAQLQGANLSNVQLEGANLSNAQLEGADLSDAQLEGANLYNAQFQRAYLRRAQLQRVYLSDAQLEGANLHNAQLEGAELPCIRLQGADLYNIQFQGANLIGANLSYAQLQGANLSDAQLQGANLSDAQLEGANLSNAQLQGANLSNAQFQIANLSDAQLQGANLLNVQLQGADLSNAKLQGAKDNDFVPHSFEERMQSRIEKDTALGRTVVSGGLKQNQVNQIMRSVEYCMSHEERSEFRERLEKHVGKAENYDVEEKEGLNAYLRQKRGARTGILEAREVEKIIAQYKKAMSHFEG